MISLSLYNEKSDTFSLEKKLHIRNYNLSETHSPVNAISPNTISKQHSQAFDDVKINETILRLMKHRLDCNLIHIWT